MGDWVFVCASSQLLPGEMTVAWDGGTAIAVFNHGRMRRDFTFIDDIVEGVIRTSDHTAQPNPDWNSDAPDSATSKAPYRLYNIGNNNPVELMHLIATLEQALGRTAEKRMPRCFIWISTVACPITPTVG